MNGTSSIGELEKRAPAPPAWNSAQCASLSPSGGGEWAGSSNWKTGFAQPRRKGALEARRSPLPPRRLRGAVSPLLALTGMCTKKILVREPGLLKGADLYSTEFNPVGRRGATGDGSRPRGPGHAKSDSRGRAHIFPSRRTTGSPEAPMFGPLPTTHTSSNPLLVFRCASRIFFRFARSSSSSLFLGDRPKLAIRFKQRIPPAARPAGLTNGG